MALLPVLWGSSKIDFTQPFAATALPCFAGTMLLVCFLLLYVTLERVKSRADAGRVSNPGDSPSFTKAADGTVSIAEYDAVKVKEARQQLIVSACIGGALYFKMGYTHPLLAMCVMQPMQLVDNKAIWIYLLGRDGPEYARPWSPPGGTNPLQQWAERKKQEAEAAEAARKAKNE